MAEPNILDAGPLEANMLLAGAEVPPNSELFWVDGANLMGVVLGFQV